MIPCITRCVLAAALVCATSVCAAGTLGIEGGYFTCDEPEGWEFIANDPDFGDDRTYLIGYAGPRAEDAPVVIYIEFYGAGNGDFDGYEDFVQRNTTDVLGETTAVAEKTKLGEMDALTFGYERKEYLHPHSKDDTFVIMKKRYYVILAKDREGFFVLDYSAPKSVFDRYLPDFERVVNSFKLA